MSLVPKIKAEYKAVNNSLILQDVTGLYDASTNPFGWGGENDGRDDVNSCIVELTNKVDGVYNIISTVDVTAVVAAAASSGEMGVPPEEIINLGNHFIGKLNIDGIYRVKYIVNNSAGEDISYKTVRVFVYKELQNIITSFWARLADIHDIYHKKNLEEECIWLQSNLDGLISISERGLESQYLNLYKFMRQRIKVNESLIN